MSPRAPLRKCRNQVVVNLAVAGILKLRKTGDTQSITPPLCNHGRLGILIMHQINLLHVVNAF